MKIFLSLVVCYLLGSIPTAYLFGKMLKGVDIREHGSGNVGATNAFRVLGKKPGIMVLCLDILKGIIAVALLPQLVVINEDPILLAMMGLVVVAGHNWTCFLQFKGGKGIATSLGVLIGLTIQIGSIRPVLAVTLFSWILVFCLSGFVSLASILAAIILPVTMVITNQPFSIVLMSAVFCIFIVFRHRSNIGRLFAGKESRVNLPFKKRP